MPETQLPESAELVLTVFDQIIDRVKSTQPIRTDGKSLTAGIVYSQLVLGKMIDPREYRRPWSPMGGSDIAEALSKGEVGVPAAAPPAATGAAAAAAQPAPDPKVKRAIDAAWRTSELVDYLIMVTKDNSYLEFPAQRRLSTTYDAVLNAMQAMAAPPPSPEIQKRIEEATKVLYEAAEEEDALPVKSRLYRRYLDNATKYAAARSLYERERAAALSDPARADSWPMEAILYQQQVDQAFDALKSEGAAKVEAALDTLAAVGRSVQEGMIKKAKKLFDAWNLGLTGVAAPIPYSYLSPRDWADPDANDLGWQHLSIDSRSYRAHAQTASAKAGAAAACVGFVNLAASGAVEKSTNKFRNDTRNLKIELDYGLVDAHRPWCLGDLFYLRDWYLVNGRKLCISNGTLDGQNESLIPMIPVQFLVIRNLTISAQWGHSDAQTIRDMKSAKGGFALGPISFGGSYCRANTEADHGWDFDGTTLTIRGAQIVAWLSQILPACPPLDDPNLDS